MGRHSRSVSRSRSRGRAQEDGYDEEQDGYRVHVADLGVDCSQKELERAFAKFGSFRELWLAKNPPCFAFIVYKRKSDGEDAIKEMDGRVVCSSRVRCSWARPRTRGGQARSGGAPRFDAGMRCYQCGERGHFSRDCMGRRGGYERLDERRTRRRRSRSRSRSRDRKRDRRSRSRSRSPRRSQRSRSDSRDRRRRNRSRSNEKRKERSRSRSQRKSIHKNSKSRSPVRNEDTDKVETIEINGTNGLENGNYERSRSRSPQGSPRDSPSDEKMSPLNEPSVNDEIYDPAHPDDGDDDKLDLSHNGDALITADYNSDN